MSQPIREVMLSLQHLSAVVLPELKRVSNVILASASYTGIAHATTLDTLILDSITYLLDVAADDLGAKCLVVSDFSDDGVFIERIFAARALRKIRRITTEAHARDENLFGEAEIASLVDLATDCGDLRRIDVLLHRDHFTECLTRWIQALVSQKKVTKLVNNVIFHCEYGAERPSVLSEPIASLPKRKWQTTNVDETSCELEDAEEKTVFAYRNENIAHDITAVFARYSYFSIHPQMSIAFNFIFNRCEGLDIGDFSRKHLRSAGMCWHERMSDFD